MSEEERINYNKKLDKENADRKRRGHKYIIIKGHKKIINPQTLTHLIIHAGTNNLSSKRAVSHLRELYTEARRSIPGVKIIGIEVGTYTRTWSSRIKKNTDKISRWEKGGKRGRKPRGITSLNTYRKIAKDINEFIASNADIVIDSSYMYDADGAKLKGYFYDAIHINSKGHQSWADQIIEKLSSGESETRPTTPAPTTPPGIKPPSTTSTGLNIGSGIAGRHGAAEIEDAFNFLALPVAKALKVNFDGTSESLKGLQNQLGLPPDRGAPTIGDDTLTSIIYTHKALQNKGLRENRYHLFENTSAFIEKYTQSRRFRTRVTKVYTLVNAKNPDLKLAPPKELGFKPLASKSVRMSTASKGTIITTEATTNAVSDILASISEEEIKEIIKPELTIRALENAGIALPNWTDILPGAWRPPMQPTEGLNFKKEDSGTYGLIKEDPDTDISSLSNKFYPMTPQSTAFAAHAAKTTGLPITLVMSIFLKESGKKSATNIKGNFRFEPHVFNMITKGKYLMQGFGKHSLGYGWNSSGTVPGFHRTRNRIGVYWDDFVALAKQQGGYPSYKTLTRDLMKLLSGYPPGSPERARREIYRKRYAGKGIWKKDGPGGNGIRDVAWREVGITAVSYSSAAKLGRSGNKSMEKYWKKDPVATFWSASWGMAQAMGWEWLVHLPGAQGGGRGQLPTDRDGALKIARKVAAMYEVYLDENGRFLRNGWDIKDAHLKGADAFILWNKNNKKKKNRFLKGKSIYGYGKNYNGSVDYGKALVKVFAKMCAAYPPENLAKLIRHNLKA